MARGLPFKTVSPQNLPKLCSGKGSISKQIKSVYPSHITVAAFFLKQSRMYNLPSSALCTFSGIAMTRDKTHQYFSWQLSKHKLHQTLLLTEAIHKSKKKLHHSWRNPSVIFKKRKWLVHCLPVRGTWSWVQPNILNKADKKKKKRSWKRVPFVWAQCHLNSRNASLMVFRSCRVFLLGQANTMWFEILKTHRHTQQHSKAQAK